MAAVVRLGLLGAGRIGQSHATTIARQADGIALDAFVDAVPEAAVAVEMGRVVSRESEEGPSLPAAAATTLQPGALVAEDAMSDGSVSGWAP